MKYAGIDIGYGFLKITDGTPLAVIPSVIGQAVDLTFDTGNAGNPLENLRVVYEGEEYFVGENAIIQSENPYRALSTDRTKDIVTNIMFLTSLALLSNKPVEQFVVVTGLPVKDFTLYKDLYVEKFVGIHEIVVNGEPKTLMVDKVIVVPQPYGTYVSQLWKEDGDFDEEFASDHVGILDIGFGTSDFIQVNKYQYLEKFSSTSANGISSVYREISNFLTTTHGIKKEQFELEDIIRSGKMKIRGGVIDLSEEIAAAKRSLAKKIAVEIKSSWTNFMEIGMILITGGGGAFLFEELKELLGDDILLVKNPQTANVVGYQQWGLAQDADETGDE